MRRHPPRVRRARDLAAAPQGPPDNERFAPTASRYNRAFDLAAVGERVGYPAYMKPFHGGGWVNVHRIGSPGELLAAYRRLVDDYYEADRFREFCDTHLSHADECMAEYVASPRFDAHLVETIKGAFPPHEHERFVAHYRGLLGAWVNDQRAAAGLL